MCGFKVFEDTRGVASSSGQAASFYLPPENSTTAQSRKLLSGDDGDSPDFHSVLVRWRGGGESRTENGIGKHEG